MGGPALKKEILDQVDKLGVEQQRQVLRFARALAAPRSEGVSGKELLRFAGAIERDDLQQIARAIDEGCEQVNLDVDVVCFDPSSPAHRTRAALR